MEVLPPPPHTMRARNIIIASFVCVAFAFLSGLIHGHWKRLQRIAGEHRYEECLLRETDSGTSLKFAYWACDMRCGEDRICE